MGKLSETAPNVQVYDNRKVGFTTPNRQVRC